MIRKEGKKEVGKAKEADPFLSSSAFSNRIPKLFIQPSLENFSSFLELLPFCLGCFAVRDHSLFSHPPNSSCSYMFISGLRLPCRRDCCQPVSLRTPAKPHLTKEANGQLVLTQQIWYCLCQLPPSSGERIIHLLHGCLCCRAVLSVPLVFLTWHLSNIKKECVCGIVQSVPTTLSKARMFCTRGENIIESLQLRTWMSDGG